MIIRRRITKNPEKPHYRRLMHGLKFLALLALVRLREKLTLVSWTPNIMRLRTKTAHLRSGYHGPCSYQIDFRTDPWPAQAKNLYTALRTPSG